MRMLSGKILALNEQFIAMLLDYSDRPRALKPPTPPPPTFSHPMSNRQRAKMKEAEDGALWQLYMRASRIVIWEEASRL